MRRLALPCGLIICALPTVAHADEGSPAEPVAVPVAPAAAPAEPAPATPTTLGYGALPGGEHVAAAALNPVGQLAVSAVAGFGYRPGLLGPDHRFDRVSGQLAASYTFTPWLAAALSLAGRYDRHFGLVPSGEDGWVGDPRLLVRALGRSAALTYGAQVGVWVPGKDAPSVALAATSVDVTGLLGYRTGGLELAVNAGLRLDNSAESIADATTLTPQDQVSLGVAKGTAVTGGVRLTSAMGKATLGLEASGDAYVAGDAADDSPGTFLRAGVDLHLAVSSTMDVYVFVQGAKGPGVNLSAVTARAIPLVPYEPMVSGGVGLQLRFGGPSHAKGYTIDPRLDTTVIVKDMFAEVTGEVLDDAGQLVIGAKVTVNVGDKTGTTATDEQGRFRVGELPLGESEIVVELEGKKPRRVTQTLVEGSNAVPTVRLDSDLPPGQLRAGVRTFGGKAVAAKITITPGDQAVTAGADGTFEVDLAPGTYEITVAATGFKTQTLTVVIVPNGVAIKNIDLVKGR